MFILHIALQGCVRATDVAYGLTPDTGGHIKYLLELVAAVDRRREVHRQEIVVRRFEDADLGADYARRTERISSKSRIVRIDGRGTAYVSKEEMEEQLDALTRSLERHLRSLDRLPDVIHAHYADAGALALAMRRRFGIPVVFTAHSLGRVKREAEPHLARDARLSRRIAMEDRVLHGVDAIVASSTNEAREQYGLYDAVDPARVRVNPPGCDLSLQEMRCHRADARAAASLDRFLREPDRPLVLAIARPVRKKNLAGLVRAFGGDARLRAKANLAIVAGCRTELGSLDGEADAVMTELLRLVDDYDLWGQVALPKRHEPADVPAFYRHAAARGGVFANPATNEPFGLTLLEAAACGLPVVATDCGGPVDIVGHCRNGLLVDPCDPTAWGHAMADLIADRARWSEAAANGRRRAAHFDWDRHVDLYMRDLARLVDAPIRPRAVDRLFDRSVQRLHPAREGAISSPA